MFLFCTLITILCYTSPLNMIVMLFSLSWVWGCANVGMTDLWVNASLCPWPLCSSLCGGLEQRTPRTVSHTVITDCTARDLSSFNSFVFFTEISMSACLLSAGLVFLHFQLLFSDFHLVFSSMKHCSITNNNKAGVETASAVPVKSIWNIESGWVHGSFYPSYYVHASVRRLGPFSLGTQRAFSASHHQRAVNSATICGKCTRTAVYCSLAG